MGIRELAQKDLGRILEDKKYGFGWVILLTAPDGQFEEFTGFSNDISQMIDPDTGVLVSGRSANIALRISVIEATGMALPRAVADTAKKPWLVTFNDINGHPFTFKVKSSNPDRALGLITCILETYNP